MDNPDKKSTSLEDRLIGAVVSAFAAACTIIVLSLLFLAVSAKGGSAEPALSLFPYIYPKGLLIIITVSSILGFFLSFDKITNIFSFFWGTHSVWEEDWMQKLAIAIVITIAIGVVVHYLLSDK